MKEYRILKFLDIFKNLFESFHIDYKAMRKILQIKLTLDSRRVATVLQNTNRDKKDEEKNNFIRSLWIYLLFGLVMIPLILFGENYLFQMSIVFGMFMFFLSTSLISDFSSVLLDLRDKEILLSRPINNKTLNMAKLLHILFYVSMISLAITGPSLIISLFTRGILFFLLYTISIILIDLFLVVLTGLMYLLILRFFDGEKLKDIINYVQIGLTITLSIGYQLIIRVFDFIDLQTIQINNKWWNYILPPIWFAAPFELILNNKRSNSIVIYSLMALIIPIISIIIYIKSMPAFERNLQKLDSAGGIKKDSNKFTNLMAKLVCRRKEERSFYRFTTNMLKNERVFKLKVYPSLGMGFIFPFIMMLSLVAGKGFSEIRESKVYFNMYFVSFAIIAIIQFLSYSGNYKGAWIYKVSPIDHYESINRGAVKAAFINLFTPLYTLVSIIFLVIFQFKIIPHILIIYLNMMLASAIIFKIHNKDLPFSRAFEVSQKGGLGETLLSFLILGALFGIHFVFERINYGIYIYLVIAIIGNGLAWKYGFKETRLAD